MTLSVHFIKRLRNFTLDVSLDTQNQSTALLGASGAGKTMILKCISGIETPDSGFIHLNGRTLFDSDKKINLKPQQRQVGYLFQNYALFPHFTVTENIACGLRNGHRQRIRELLHLFHLEDLANSYPAKLSGGQQQRVALARMLAAEPQILLLDEPFSALDQFLRENLEMEMKRLLAQYARDTLLVTHHRDEAYRLCENLVILEKGQVLEKGNLKQIFEQPRFLASAKLTGCKNFSAVTQLSDHEVFAEDWGITLNTHCRVDRSITHIGIRDHSFYPADSPDDLNAFEVTLKEVTETPFEHQWLLATKQQGEIWWATPKTSDNPQCPEYLTVLPKDIYLLRSQNGEKDEE